VESRSELVLRQYETLRAVLNIPCHLFNVGAVRRMCEVVVRSVGAGKKLRGSIGARTFLAATRTWSAQVGEAGAKSSSRWKAGVRGIELLEQCDQIMELCSLGASSDE